ncbi:MAG: T9SS type A sorting domain-containing protein [Paludibacter sp.]|nr:T9SS type A sorting domain-containing protein [Paludibacter sp.]
MMRKITLLFAILMASAYTFGATGWYSDYVLIKLNGGSDNYYWIGSNPSFGTELNGANLGTVSSFTIGCDMKYWSDTQDRTGGAFYYKIMSADNTTQVVAPVEVVWSQTALGGNDYQGLSATTTNVLAGLANSTTYKLHVWAKSWGSNQVDSWLSNGGANYVATFTTDLGTNTNIAKSALKIYTSGNEIKAEFSGYAHIELFSITGQMIKSVNVTNNFSSSVQPGIYMLRINGTTHRVLVN